MQRNISWPMAQLIARESRICALLGWTFLAGIFNIKNIRFSDSTTVLNERKHLKMVIQFFTIACMSHLRAAGLQ